MINTTAPHQSGFRRFLSLINLAAVSAVMLAASGCHKDSFSFDETTRPTISGPTTPDDGNGDGDMADFVVDANTNVGDINAAYGPSIGATRAGGGDITSRQHNDPNGNPRVVMRIWGRAHLAIVRNDDMDAANVDFFHLNENVVTPPTPSSTIAGAAADTMVRAIAFNGINPPTFPTATYALEGEMTYNGNRFYPDGELMADFANARIGGEISLAGVEADDDFGGATFADGTTPITNSDNLTLGLGDVSDAANSGDILDDDLGFSGALNIITAEGFFSSLSGRPTGTYSGRFNDDTDSYVGGNEATAAPQEISGIFGGITDANNNELKGGFLGQCSADCRLPVIRVMSSTPTAQERNGRIVLMITSDLSAPTGGLAVDINIGGALDGEFTANMEADCTNFPRCTVTILSGMQMVELTLTPTADFSTEGTEDWTATLEDLGNYAVDPDPTNSNFAFTITDLIAAVGIMTSDTPMEGGAAVTLTITSSETVPDTLTGGLAVTVSIRDANANEFTANAVCTNLVCIVTIPAGSNSVSLILTPLSDFSTEPGERWTATLEDGSNYNLDAGNNNVGFAITDLIANIRIMTSDTPMEGGAAVTLTITSSETVPDTLTGGLAVTVSIRDADADEFTANAVCTNLVCIVTIPAGSNSVSLILSPLSDFSTESERWTASLRDGSDYNLDANDNAAFDIDDLIAAVGIATNDMPIEGGAAVTLTITSDETVPATLTGGLSVTINIVGADAADFNNAVCTNIVCIVTIPAGSNSVSLILSPLSDFSTETGESWRAEIVNGDDYNPATDFNVNFDITDLIAAVGIATSDTARIEGGAVTLTITSDLPVPAALTDGLSVTINIVGANAADFTSADCTGLECVVVIPIGMTAATLTIMALDTDSVENIERWTAMIFPVNTVFSVDSNADDADFSITDPTFPTAMDGRTLDDLIPLDNMPDILGVDEIRAGGDENATRAEIPITGLRYNDADGNPQIYVQRLTYANLGIWTNGQEPTIITSSTATASDFDNDFRYGFFNDNAIAGSDFPDSGQANYEVEGDATYRGVNFFIEGSINAMFTAGTFISNLGAGGGDALDDFGSANAMVPDVDDLDGDGDTAELRTVATSDRLLIFTNGGINNDGFSGTPRLDQSGGFFADLAAFTSASFSGRFYDDSATYDGMITAPDELAGTGVFVGGGGMDDLHFGFLGQCFTGCNSFPNIGISSPDSTAQENSGEIVLVIEADANTLADLDVMVQISGTGLMANEFDTTPASACNNLFVCTIRIPSGDMAVSLTLTPIDDSAVETTENWIATVIDGSNYNLNFGSIVVAFDITDSPVPLPIASPDRTLAELNAYATPVVLASTAIRAGADATTNVGTFVGARYNDAAGLPQIYVQRVLERSFAHLGIWVNGQVPTPGDSDHDFRYASLADNAVSNLPTSGIAQYFFEADATYKGVNFFPDGSLVMDFGANNYRGSMDVEGSQGANGADYFGVGGTLPDGTNPSALDSLSITYEQANGTIAADGTFGGSWTIPIATADDAPTGFFSDLAGATGGTISGRFYHSSGYNPATRDPFEIAGNGMISDTAIMPNELRFGFIGSCVIPMSSLCGPGNTNIVTPNIVTP